MDGLQSKSLIPFANYHYLLTPLAHLDRGRTSLPTLFLLSHMTAFTSLERLHVVLQRYIQLRWIFHPDIQLILVSTLVKVFGGY